MRSTATYRIALIVLTLLAAATGRAEAAASQRMVIPPGCYSLSPGDHYDVPAYCLDQTFSPPPSGADLSYAPASFGDAAVLVQGGVPLTLQAALQQHLVAVEGLGDHRRVRLRNLGAEKIQICIRAPTVVMGNGDYYTGDLPRVYDDIAKMLAPAPAGATASSPTEEMDREAHDKLQRRLWAAVNSAKAKSEEDRREPDAVRATYPKPAERLPAVAPDPSKCADQTSGVAVCQGK